MKVLNGPITESICYAPDLSSTGKFVSESKFRQHPSLFIPHILHKDRAALEDLITKPAVERELLSRLIKKTTIYGADIGLDGEPVRAPKSPKSPVDFRIRRLPPHMTPKMDMQAKALPKEDTPLFDLEGQPDDEFSVKIDVEEVKHLYERWIIPLTKEVEVRASSFFPGTA